MPQSSNVLNEARTLVEKRLKELDQERTRLERALADLVDGVPTRRKRGRPRGSTNRRRGRRGGTRSDQAVQLVEKNPGISASQIAKQLKIKPNYLYRVMGELQKDGRVTKKGREYHPA